MNSNKNLIIGIVVAVAVVLIGWIVLKDNDSVDNPLPSASPKVSASVSVKPSPTPTPTPKAVMHTVRLTSQGLQPKTLTIRRGDAVSFVNETGMSWWPASDPHPTHTLCQGFDASRTLGNGESYTLTFNTVKTCSYHNHLDNTNTASQGTIIVQ